MSRNLIFAVVAVLGISAGALGFWLYQERQRSGVEITIGGHGVSVRER